MEESISEEIVLIEDRIEDSGVTQGTPQRGTDHP